MALAGAVAVALLLLSRERVPRPAPETPAPAPAVDASPPEPERRHAAPAAEVHVELDPPPAAESPPPAVPSRDVQGTVVDGDGEPIADATVALFAADESPVAQATSDAAGAFRCADAADEAVLLVARRQGFAVEFVQIAPPAVEPLRVQLRRGASVTGEVRLITGGTPRVPVHVLVTPRKWHAGLRGGYGPDVERAAERGDPRLLTVAADADGRFRVDGLVDGGAYLVRAGGEGLGLATVDMMSEVPARAGGDPVTVWLAPLYVLDVRFLDENGALLRTRPGVETGHTAPVSYSGPFSSDHAVAGLWSGAVRTTGGDGPFHLLSLKTAPVEQDRIGPFLVTAIAPGYEPLTVEAWAPRVRPGGVDPLEFRMKPVADSFGDLRIRFDDRGTGYLAICADRPAQAGPLFAVPRVVLRPQEGATKGLTWIFVDARAAVQGADVIDVPHLPCARYDALLTQPYGSAESRAWSTPVTIEPGRTAELLVPVPEWAGLELLPRGDGADDLGFVEVRVRRPGHDGFKNWFFFGPPYRIVGPEPGTWEVELRARDFQPAMLTVDLLPDRLTPVPCEIVPEE